MNHAIPWKVLVTVPSLAVIAIVFATLGEIPLAAAAAGALIGYLGKVNGSAPATNTAS